MPRNLERDAQRMEMRKNQLLEAGFELFSERGIETVSLLEVAQKANVPIATLYKYYQNKVNLVVAISAHAWSEVLNNATEKYSPDDIENVTAYTMIERYADVIINIYRNNKRLLCFSNNYKTYITREKVGNEMVIEQLDALRPVSDLFFQRYEKAKADHSIRTDIPASELFTTIALTMLGMAERYAQGLVWAQIEGDDYTQSLLYLKDMLLLWAKGDK